MLVLETFAKRLRAARHAKRLTQQALATAVGSYKTDIYRLERGGVHDRISLAVLGRIGDVLGVSLDWLVRGMPAPSAQDTEDDPDATLLCAMAGP